MLHFPVQSARLSYVFASAALMLFALGSPPGLAAPDPAPGAAFDAEAHQHHLAAYETRRTAAGEAYDSRTKLSREDGSPLYLNRLITEASPYLRQHAHNPVDWRPWGPEALAEAQGGGKIIFLSVGYATCHWCHVMEAESFDDTEIAALLNRDFIPIKVDREERPDVDETYILATTLMNGVSGWPNTVWLTPEGEPFFAAGYLPKAELSNALAAIQTAWKTQPDALRATAAAVAEKLRAFSSARLAETEISESIFNGAQLRLAAQFNDLQGGFSDTVQFPQEIYLHYLLDGWRRVGSEGALEMATATLDAILAGGVHDHAGGGFHRYAVDPGWAVPHFEKMLYNQAEISRALIAAWEATGAARYRRGAERALDYALRDMRAPDGSFFTAEDADSRHPETGEKQEGAFYLWLRQPLVAALGGDPEQAAKIAGRLGVGDAPLIEAGSPLRVLIEDLERLPEFDGALETLRRARASRPRPLRDEKIIAGWNGLMIRALAEAAASFDRPDYEKAAERAMEAVWASHWSEDRLLRFAEAEKSGAADAPAALDDYAWLGLAAVALWDLTGDPAHLARARALADAALTRFADGTGRLKMSEIDGPLGPVLQHFDEAVPAGESSMLELLALLSQRDRGPELRNQADKLLAALSGGIAASPSDRVTALAAAALLKDGEAGPRRMLSSGVVHVAARRKGERVEIDLRLQPGWHVNANKPLQEFLIPTVLQGDALADVSYPAPKEVKLGFNDAPLAVLEGDAAIAATLKPNAKGEATEITLNLQACSDKICLAPEQATFRLGPME